MYIKPSIDFEDYVNAQRVVNSRHTDGAVEAGAEDVFKHIDSMLYALDRHQRLVPRPKSALFAGCRTGYEMRYFLEKWPRVEVTGIDIVPEFVAVANEIADSYVMDMHNLNFDDGAFELTFSAQALEHCHDVEKALSELLRVTKNALFLSLPLEIRSRFYENPSHFACTTSPLEWLKLLEPHRKLGWRLQYAEITKPMTLDFLVLKLSNEDDKCCTV